MEKFKQWIPALCLGIAAFVVVTTEFLPVGLLSGVAADFNMPEAKAGLIITLYAATVACFSLPMAMLGARFNRRTLLLFLLLLFMAGHVIVSLAPTFITLLGARVFIAISHALFWTMATPLAMRVAPKGQEVKALGLVITATSLAAVMGVPIGTYAGNHFGWRIAFAGVIGVSAIVWLIMYFYMPSVPSKSSGSVKTLPALFKRPGLMMTYLIFMLAIFGHYAAFAYFSPFMQKLGLFAADYVAFFLLLFGLAGILGSYLCAKYIEKYPFGGMLTPFAGVCLCLLLLRPVMGSFLLTSALCFAWGAFLTWLVVACNRAVLKMAEDAQDIAAALSNIAFNVGVAGGAFVGGQIFASYGLSWVGAAGAAVFAAAVLILCLSSGRKAELNTLASHAD